MTDGQTLAAEEGTVERFRYRPALDGIRACAILGVFAFHAGTRLTGGWIGVDVFFVLSGFLITSLLLGERASNGSVSLRAFYWRRGSRLLPALFLTIAACGLTYAARPEVDRGVGFGWSVLATVFYSANLVHADLGLLLPTWSLALEEQFYVIWPLALILCWRRGWGTKRLVVLALSGAATAAVARTVLWVDGRHTDGLNWRADGLLIGCALALVWSSVGGRRLLRRFLGRTVAAAAGIAVLVIHALSVGPGDRAVFYGGLVLVNLAAGAVIVHVVATDGSPVAKLLSTRPLVWVGRRSYGIYLFHLPVFAALGTMSLSFWPTTAIRLAVTLAAAGLSFRFIESYFLRHKRYPSGLGRESAAATGIPSAAPAAAGTGA